jgi:hypothetical protein
MDGDGYRGKDTRPHTTLYKLLFQEIPEIFTAAMNQLVFNHELAPHTQFQWIKERKVIYIPKKPRPVTPEATDP